MKSLSHQQVQEIIRSGQVVSGAEKDVLLEHLSNCKECQAYSDLVNELSKVVSTIYTSPPLSELEIRHKVAAKRALIRRKFMITRLLYGTRAVVWIGAGLALLLILIVLSPRLLPIQRSGGGNSTPLAVINSLPAPEQQVAATTTISLGSILYTIAEGENLFSLADKFNLEPQTILWANTDKLHDNPHNIKPGITLKIPSTDGLYYRWKTGDTIKTIADQFGVDPKVILNWPENITQIGISQESDIKPGVLLFIPGGKMPLQPAPTIIPQTTPTLEGSQETSGLFLFFKK